MTRQATAFVRALGWLVLVLGLLVVLGAVGEAITARALLAQPHLAAELSRLGTRGSAAQGTDAVLAPVLLRRAAVHGALALAAVVAAGGLLRRREWARKGTMVLVALATLALIPEVFGDHASLALPTSTATLAFTTVCVLHWAIVRRLQRADVRAVFHAEP